MYTEFPLRGSTLKNPLQTSKPTTIYTFRLSTSFFSLFPSFLPFLLFSFSLLSSYFFFCFFFEGNQIQRARFERFREKL